MGGLFSTERFKILDFLGHGAEGHVSLVYDNILKGKYALKVFHVDPNRTQANLQEAKILEALKHQNIVEYKDCVVMKKGKIGIVMEACATNLSAKIREAAHRRPQSRVLDHYVMLHKLANALGHIHANGVVHRDIKPANILFSYDDEPKFADFGLTKYYDPTQKKHSANVGTKEYRAPEGSENMSFAFDVYALGMCFFELVSTIYYDPLTCDWTPFSNEMQSILRPMLAVDPKDRPSAKDVAGASAKMVVKELEKSKLLEQQLFERVKKAEADLQSLRKRFWRSQTDLRDNCNRARDVAEAAVVIEKYERDMSESESTG